MRFRIRHTFFTISTKFRRFAPFFPGGLSGGRSPVSRFCAHPGGQHTGGVLICDILVRQCAPSAKPTASSPTRLAHNCAPPMSWLAMRRFFEALPRCHPRAHGRARLARLQRLRIRSQPRPRSVKFSIAHPVAHGSVSGLLRARSQDHRLRLERRKKSAPSKSIVKIPILTRSSSSSPTTSASPPTPAAWR